MLFVDDEDRIAVQLFFFQLALDIAVIAGRQMPFLGDLCGNRRHLLLKVGKGRVRHACEVGGGTVILYPSRSSAYS